MGVIESGHVYMFRLQELGHCRFSHMALTVLIGLGCLLSIKVFLTWCRLSLHLDSGLNAVPSARVRCYFPPAELVSGNIWSSSSYFYLFIVPGLFSGTLNQNWANMGHCLVSSKVLFCLSIIRYGSIHWGSFVRRSVESIKDFFFTLFHASGCQRWQMRIMCNIARWTGHTCLAYQDHRTLSDRLWLK